MSIDFQISSYTQKEIDNFYSAHPSYKGDKTWVEDLIFEIQYDLYHLPKDSAKTQTQVGYLCGLMDLERDDRLWLVSLFVGYPLWYDGQPFKGYVPPEDTKHPEFYPGPSLKDPRISGAQLNYLIDRYSKNDEIKDLHGLFDLTSAKDQRKARAYQRQVARAAKAADVLAAKQSRKLAREARRQTRSQAGRV